LEEVPNIEASSLYLLLKFVAKLRGTEYV